MWAQRLCTRSTPGRTSCIGSVLNPVWVSDVANPVPNLLFTRHTSKPAQDLLRQVTNVHFMVFSKDGATASLDPHGAQKGSLTQDYVNFPTLKFGMFLPILPSSHVTSVEATDHLIGHPSCHPIYWMFQFDGSLSPLLFISSSDRAQRHSSLSCRRSPMTYH